MFILIAHDTKLQTLTETLLNMHVHIDSVVYRRKLCVKGEGICAYSNFSTSRLDALRKCHFGSIKNVTELSLAGSEIVYNLCYRIWDYIELPCSHFASANVQAGGQAIFKQTSCYAITSLVCYFFCLTSLWELKESAAVKIFLSSVYVSDFFFFSA